MDTENENDAKIITYLKENGPSRLWELTANVGMPYSTCFQRLLRLEARHAVSVTREPKRGKSSLKTIYYLAVDGEGQ